MLGLQLYLLFHPAGLGHGGVVGVGDGLLLPLPADGAVPLHPAFPFSAILLLPLSISYM